MSARSFLFLQGPVGPFFRRLGRSLEAEGHRVARVNFHGGDEHDWLKGEAYRGRVQDWPQAAARLMKECRVTDLALYGDCRPLHRTAIDAAKARGAAVHVFEEAYFRPGYMTLERGGTNGFSSLPRTPGGIRAAALQLGGEAPQPFAPQQPRGSRAFFYYARAQRSRVFGSYPYAEWHRDIAPWREGVAYARRYLRSPADRRRGANSLQALGSTRYFLLPLQMNRDYQMRVHSPYGSMEAALAGILENFRSHAPPGVHLAVKRHPLDNGLVRWHRLIGGRNIHYLPGGDLQALIAGAAGLVTVNSTSALAALKRGLPVKALGTAIYNIEGLTDPQPLASFWNRPASPDPALLADFEKLVIGRAQIPGYYSSDAGIECLIAAAKARLLHSPIQDIRAECAAA